MAQGCGKARIDRLAGCARTRGVKTLREMLEAGHNKPLALEIAAWAGRDRGRFAQLAAIMAGDDPKLAARAAWAAGTCVENHPELLAAHLPALLDRIESRGVHPAVTRNVFRMLQFAPVPGECEGRVLAAALAALGGVAPVAVKAFAITVLKRLAGDLPEIVEEVRLLIDEQWHDASPAIRVRARREFGRRRDG